MGYTNNTHSPMRHGELSEQSANREEPTVHDSINQGLNSLIENALVDSPDRPLVIRVSETHRCSCGHQDVYTINVRTTGHGQDEGLTLLKNVQKYFLDDTDSESAVEVEDLLSDEQCAHKFSPSVSGEGAATPSPVVPTVGDDAAVRSSFPPCCCAGCGCGSGALDSGCAGPGTNRGEMA